MTNIRTLYAQQKDYSGLENLSAVQMGVVPDELITATPETTKDDGLQNAFLGQVVIKATNVSGLDGEGTKETIACVGAKAAKDAKDPAITTPLNVAKAAVACSASGNTNSIVWVYY